MNNYNVISFAGSPRTLNIPYIYDFSSTLNDINEKMTTPET